MHIINIWAVLLSTIGIASYSHYCQDELKFVSFFAKLIKPCCSKKKESCHKKTLKKSCCSKTTKKRSTASIQYKSCFSPINNNKPCFKKRNCCLDKKQYAQSDLDATFGKVVLKKIPFGKNIPIDLKIHTTTNHWTTFNPFIENQYYFLCFFPPPKVSIYIAHQSFLC